MQRAGMPPGESQPKEWGAIFREGKCRHWQPRSVGCIPLEVRFREDIWASGTGWRHGPPKHPCWALDDASALLRVLHARLPLARVRKTTRTSTLVESFVQRNNKPLLDHLRAHLEDTDTSIEANALESAFSAWLQDKAVKQPKRLNKFDWEGFQMSEEECRRAVQQSVEHWLSVRPLFLRRGQDT